jgi:predicted metal-dependent peptidase
MSEVRSNEENKALDMKSKARVEQQISKLICFQPLYGTVFLFLNKRIENSIPTMAVGVIRKVDIALFFNSSFVDKLTDSELRAVLKHEALHILLHHISRTQKHEYNPKLFNYAADMVINQNIDGLPDGAIYPKTFGLENGESADVYYKLLKKKQDEQGGELSDPNGQGDGDGEGESNGIDDHSMWGDFDKEIIEQKARAISKRAMDEQDKQGWGDISGGLIEQIRSANKPKCNWKRELKYFINKLILMGRKSTRKRDNRRTHEIYPYLNPGTRRDYKSKLLLAIDTSGSVSERELQAFLNEMNGMIDNVYCEVICFDTKLYGKPKPFTKKAKSLEIEGRGGTDFHPVIEYVNEHNYDGLIVFTDGYAPFPPKPKARVMWVVLGDSNPVNFPYGKRLAIPKD